MDFFVLKINSGIRLRVPYHGIGNHAMETLEMRDDNTLVLIGHSGQDGELKVTKTGKAQLRFRLATSDSYKNEKTGEWEKTTEWHTIVVWGKEAEILAPMLKKGDRWMIRGKVHYNEFTKEDGTVVKETQIMVRDFGKMEKQMKTGGETSTGYAKPEPDGLGF